MAIAPDAEARLNAFLADQLRLLAGTDIPRSVYHYTSSQGMRAIISSGVLRAHNLGQMNDFAEGKYAASVMRAHVDRGYAIAGNPAAVELLGAMRRQLTSVDLSNVFALSFTSDGDEPGMWRLYADEGRGFSFAIPTRDALSWGGDNHKGMFVQCIYDSKTLMEFCVQALAKIRDIYLTDAAAALRPDPTEYAKMFLQNVSWFAPAFKPDVWHDEKEWRFIFTRPQSEHKAFDGRYYIELSLVLPTPTNPQPITAICAGPDCDYEDDILALQRVLHDKGFGGKGGMFPIFTSVRHVTRPGRRPPPPRRAPESRAAMKLFSRSFQYSSLKKRTNTHLPHQHHLAHELCFVLHDMMTQLLVSGREASAFTVTVTFRDDADRKAFEEGDIFDWLQASRRVDERVAILVTTVFPAVLGDMLHCFYEALETSRKGKLGVSFTLIRKPLQESLFLLESIAADRKDFADRLTSDPLKLGSQKAGGVEAHTKRIQRVLGVLGESQRFDAKYLAQLRYDKEASDGFDGICNKAIHLFTGHKAIQTEPLNINFIFSGEDAMLTQWSYLYSRLPYLLFYMHLLVEHICAEVAPTDPEYLRYCDRRLSALILLWWDILEPPYLELHLRKFVLATRDWLSNHCTDAGYRQPSRPDLLRMAETGAFPGEARRTTKNRIKKFIRDAKAS